MKKENIAIFAFAVLALSFIINASIASAQGPDLGLVGERIQTFTQFDTETILAWFILGLVILLIYSALSSVGFPESAGLRWPVAIIVGFIATMFISSEEIIAAMLSYQALGITLIVFFPLVILAFFTFTVASKANPFGLVLQRVAWIIYSIYLFIRTGLALGAAYTGDRDPASSPFLGLIKRMSDFFGTGASASGDTTILMILFIVSIAIFFIFVFGNKKITEWFMKERRHADLARYKDTAERAKEARETEAEMTR